MQPLCWTTAKQHVQKTFHWAQMSGMNRYLASQQEGWNQSHPEPSCKACSVSAWVLTGYSSLLPQSKDMNIRLFLPTQLCVSVMAQWWIGDLSMLQPAFAQRDMEKAPAPLDDECRRSSLSVLSFDGWTKGWMEWQMGGWMDRWRCILSLRESNSAQNNITCPQIQWWRGLSECYLDRCTPEADSFRLGSFWFHSASFWGHKLKRRTEGIGSLHVARKTQANLITHIMKKRRHIQCNNNGTTAEYKVKIKPPMSIRSTSDLQQLYVY